MRCMGCVVLLAAIALHAPTRAAQEECSCKHLRAIEDRLKQAEAARDIYRTKAEQLERAERAAGEDPDRLQELRESYKSWRENEFSNEFARRAGHATGRAGATASDVESVTFDWQSCTTDTAALYRAMAREACRELGEILLHHENFHEDVCASTKARRLREPPPPRQTQGSIEAAVSAIARNRPSGDAWDEVGAYSLEIDEINKLLDTIGSEYGVEYTAGFEALMTGTTVRWTVEGFVPLTVATGPYPRRVSGSAVLRLKGEFSGGQCSGVAQPASVPLTVTGRMTAKDVVLTLQHTSTTSWLMRCPGMPKPITFPYVMVPQLNDMRFDNTLGAKVVTRGPGAASLPTGLNAANGGWELTLKKECRRPE